MLKANLLVGLLFVRLMASQSGTLAVVTGGNKGIGFEIVRQLAQQGVRVVLTARDEGRGLAAKSRLISEGLDVEFHPLDVTSGASVSALAKWLKEEHNGLDILVNNAAVFGDTYNYDAAQHLLNTNYEGVKRTTKAFLPLLKATEAGSRIVNISSGLGQLERLGLPEYKKQMNDVHNLSEERIDAFVQHYLSDVKQGREDSIGWPRGLLGAYTISKIAVNAYTRLVARDLKNSGRSNLYVNSIHPGYVKTDMNNNKGILSAEQGADTAVWLALLPPGGPSGEFFFQRSKFNF